MCADLSKAGLTTTLGARAVPPVPTVPCVYCREEIAAGTFSFRSTAKRLVTATCASCARRNTLSTTTWRRWAGLSSPAAPSRVADLTVAGQYIPATVRGEPVAGDFFDVVEFHPGRILIAVGDVSGHGVDAAVRMNQLRVATHSIASRSESPVEILQLLDDLQDESAPEDIATIWIGTYNSRTGVLQYASAGHLPPVIAGFGDRTILLAEATAPPLGTGVVGAFAPLEEIYLPLGSYLIAFSDGLVERPGCDLDSQLSLLREIVDRASSAIGAKPTAQELVDLILEELVPDPSSARDDVSLVVLLRDTLAIPAVPTLR